MKRSLHRTPCNEILAGLSKLPRAGTGQDKLSSVGLDEVMDNRQKFGRSLNLINDDGVCTRCIEDQRGSSCPTEV